jgi:uncharacterized membrane protein
VELAVEAAPSFLNLHPLFVHAPLVLVPLAAVMTWLGHAVRKDGFDLATLLITVAAAVTAVLALVSGWWAEGTFPANPAMHDLMENHETLAVVVTTTTAIAALLAFVAWRGVGGARVFWARGGVLTFATLAVLVGGHWGAQLVYLHGAAVVPVANRMQTAPK